MAAVLAGVLLLGWLALRPDAVPPGMLTVPDATMEFVRGNNADPESLDPLQARSEPALNVLRDLHEGLTTLDAAGEVIPGAARRWEMSGDGLAWRFELDPAARWSDGRRVTAEDFSHAFSALADASTASPHAAMFEAIAAVHTEAEDRLRIVLRHPVPWLPALLAHPAAGPRRADLPADGRVSSGAYVLAARHPGSDLLLERNPSYRAADRVGVGRVRYLPIEDHAAELSRYRAGELDMTYTVPVSRVPWLREHMPEELRLSPYLAVYFYGFNTRRPPLDDERVRRALSLAVDRDLLTARVTGAGEQPACSLVPPALPDYDSPRDEMCEARRSTRVARATELLAEAGYGPARPLQLEIRYNTGELHERIAVAVSTMWRDALGVETTLVGEEFRVLLSKVRAGEVTQVYRGSWIADFAAPESFLGILAGDSPVNGTGWAEPDYDRLLQEAALQPNRAAGLQRLARAEALALEAAPLLPLYFYVSKKLVKPHVRGVQDNPLNVHPSRFVTLERGAAGR